MIHRRVEAETVGDLPIGGVPQYHLAAADHDRHVVDGDLETVQQRLDTGIPVEVDGRVRMAVTRQELLDAERTSGMTRPDEHDIADPMRHQLYPTEEEGPQEDLAQFAVGLHEREHVFALDLDYCARLSGTYADEPTAPREHGDLARKLPRSQGGHEFLCDACEPDDRDVTRGDDEKPRVCSPASMSTSPRWTWRTWPCTAMRAICSDVKIGNAWSTREASVNGTGGVVSDIRLSDVQRTVRQRGYHRGCAP